MYTFRDTYFPTPRVYGGTRQSGKSTTTATGLSPRVRGNLPGFSGGRTGAGSIPACTGEPWLRFWLRNFWKVYPRVYGGTLSWKKAICQGSGLSPRVRGNPPRLRGSEWKSDGFGRITDGLLTAPDTLALLKFECQRPRRDLRSRSILFTEPPSQPQAS